MPTALANGFSDSFTNVNKKSQSTVNMNMELLSLELSAVHKEAECPTFQKALYILNLPCFVIM